MGDLEARIEAIAGRLIPKRLFKGSLDRQVRLAESMMGAAGMVNLRASLLRDSGMPADIRDLQKGGMTRDEIKGYYWGCARFRKFWATLEMTEGMIDSLIDTSLGGA